MNKTKTFVFLGIAILALGCAGPKIKEALTALTPKVDELEMKVTEARAVLDIVKGFEVKVADPKFAKDKDGITKLATEIENTKTAIGTVLTLEGEVTPIADSLAVLDKKAKGEDKTAIAGLNEKIAAIRAGFGEFQAANAALDGLKVKLDEMKAPAKKVAVKAPVAKKK